ncbi:unnamed protein product [Blepharisma stoltei]|uniref:DNA polymerase alpha subunit B n=1 Tax=Blepharisma stoltei TaxID=1481888 RepID=A0AAU9JXT6_9CILI|nr:unnamed protein product [Blepharisma stoltei]
MAGINFASEEDRERYEEIVRMTNASRQQINDELEAIFMNKKAQVVNSSITAELQKILKKYEGNKKKPAVALSANKATLATRNVAYQYVPDNFNFIFEAPNTAKIMPKVLNTWNGYYFGEPSAMATQELENQLEKMTRRYKDSFGIEEFQRLTQMSGQETISVVGRVCIDDRDEKNDIYLEDISSSVALDLKALPEYVLFNGQIIIAKGTCDSFVFSAEQIGTEINLEWIDRKSSEWAYNEPPVIVAVAAGPFTDPDNLEYLPLQRFIDTIANNVNSLILIGPLVDAEHRIIKCQQINSQFLNVENGTYEDLFNALSNYINSRFKEVIIVPSIREMTHFYPLPQPPYDGMSASNPCTLKIKDVTIGIVPYDLWKEVISSSTYKSRSMINKIEVASHQILHQLSYLPVYPSDLPVEYAHYSKFQLDNPPHIILTSSSMALQTFREGGTICVNIQNLLKSPGQVTYCLINIASPMVNQERIAVKIVKDSFQ